MKVAGLGTNIRNIIVDWYEIIIVIIVIIILTIICTIGIISYIISIYIISIISIISPTQINILYQFISYPQPRSRDSTKVDLAIDARGQVAQGGLGGHRNLSRHGFHGWMKQLEDFHRIPSQVLIVDKSP